MLRRSRIAPTLVLVVTASCLLVTGLVQAELLPHYDLAGLVLRSDSIVLARRGKTDALGAGVMKSAEFHVEKVYKGSTLPGVKIRVGLMMYQQQILTPGEDLSKATDYVLFLDGVASGAGAAGGGRSPPQRSLVHSGLRLLWRNRVYTFQQIVNPGPYLPWEEIRFGLDSCWHEGSSERVSLKIFEADLRRVISRVEAYRRAESESDPGARRRKLLETLGPVAPTPVFLRQLVHSKQPDTLDRKIFREIAEQESTPLLLEALARFPARWALCGSDSLERLDPAILFRIVEDNTLPLHDRVTALLSLPLSAPHPERNRPDFFLEVLEKASIPELRRAAVLLLGTLPRGIGHYRMSYRGRAGSLRDAAEEAILRAWRLEKDPLVRMALLEVGSSRYELFDRMAEEPGGAILLAGVHRGQICYLGARREGKPQKRREFTAAMRPQSGGKERTFFWATPFKEREEGRSVDLGKSWGGLLPLRLHPPLEPGSYVVQIRQKTGERTVSSNEFPLSVSP